MIEDLIAMGADINVRALCPEQFESHPRQYSLLGKAVHDCNFIVLKELLKQKEIDLNNRSYVYCLAHDFDNHVPYSPLMIAIEAKSTVAVTWLLTAGAAAECDDFEGTPLVIVLYLASCEDQGEEYMRNGYAMTIIKQLLKYGADPINAVKMLDCIRDVPANIKIILVKEAFWIKNKNFVMFLQQSGCISGCEVVPSEEAAASASAAALCPTLSVFCNIDLCKHISSFIPLPLSVSEQKMRCHNLEYRNDDSHDNGSVIGDTEMEVEYECKKNTEVKSIDSVFTYQHGHVFDY